MCISTTRSRRIYVTGRRNPDTDSIAAAVGVGGQRPDGVGARALDHRARLPAAHRCSGRATSCRPSSRCRATMSRCARCVWRWRARISTSSPWWAVTGGSPHRARAGAHPLHPRVARDVQPGRRADHGRDRGDAGGRAAGRQGRGRRPRLGARDGRAVPDRIEASNVVVVATARTQAIELGAALIVVSNGAKPGDDVVKLATERGTAVVVSPLERQRHQDDHPRRALPRRGRPAHRVRRTTCSTTSPSRSRTSTTRPRWRSTPPPPVG